MKKKTIPAQKLKLNKEKIASLTQNYTKVVFAGGTVIKQTPKKTNTCYGCQSALAECNF